jgi:hypothetical protein
LIFDRGDQIAEVALSPISAATSLMQRSNHERIYPDHQFYSEYNVYLNETKIAIISKLLLFSRFASTRHSIACAGTWWCPATCWSSYDMEFDGPRFRSPATMNTTQKLETGDFVFLLLHRWWRMRYGSISPSGSTPARLNRSPRKNEFSDVSGGKGIGGGGWLELGGCQNW